MCDVDIEQLKKNLQEMKEYADKFPANSGWRWASESLDKTMKLLEPQPEPESKEGFDMPIKTEEPSKTEAKPKPSKSPVKEVVVNGKKFPVTEIPEKYIKEVKEEPAPTDHQKKAK